MIDGAAGGRYIEFQVASHVDALCCRTNFLKPPRVFPSLGQKKIHLLQDSFQQYAACANSRPGTVRNAGVHHGDPRPAGMGKAQEIWPELGFRDHNELGL